MYLEKYQKLDSLLWEIEALQEQWRLVKEAARGAGLADDPTFVTKFQAVIEPVLAPNASATPDLEIWIREQYGD